MKVTSRKQNIKEYIGILALLELLLFIESPRPFLWFIFIPDDIFFADCQSCLKSCEILQRQKNGDFKPTPFCSTKLPKLVLLDQEDAFKYYSEA